LFSVGQKKIDDKFFSLLESNRCSEAINYLMSDKLSSLLIITEPSASVARSSKNLDEPAIKNLAETVWQHTCLTSGLEDQGILVGDEDQKFKLRYGQTFVASQSMFSSAISAIDEYSAWLLERELPRVNYKPREVAGHGSYLDMAIKKDFEKLYNCQEEKLWR
jgi:hypothetical protein